MWGEAVNLSVNTEWSEQSVRAADAISWFTAGYPNPPTRAYGMVDYEALCGEFLVEGEDYQEVKRHYEDLPPELKRKAETL